jgi:hypothetical protein
VNNLLRIMSLDEDTSQRVVFVRQREEAGIGFVYDPVKCANEYQVFIHSTLPYREIETLSFASFAEARSLAAKKFADWEMLAWDLKTKRPCEEGGKECGSGECDTCKTLVAEGAKGADGCGSCGGA